MKKKQQFNRFQVDIGFPKQNPAYRSKYFKMDIYENPVKNQVITLMKHIFVGKSGQTIARAWSHNTNIASC